MEDNILIKSERVSLKPFNIIIILCIAIICINTLDWFIKSIESLRLSEEECNLRSAVVGYRDYDYDKHQEAKKAYREASSKKDDAEEKCMYMNIPLSIITLITFMLYFSLKNSEIVISNKRVYGRTAFGKRVDLPVDSISAISKSILKGISVSTSSGAIKFIGIKNQSNIYNTLSNLLIERQNQNNYNKEFVSNNQKLSKADELKQFKELLDSGIITQEEFDAKKRQLLGL